MIDSLQKFKGAASSGLLRSTDILWLGDSQDKQRSREKNAFYKVTPNRTNFSNLWALLILAMLLQF